MGNAGRVLMIPKGEYNSATTYQMLDFVYYQGRSYVCKQTSTGNVPTNTTYWQALTGDASAEIQALTNQVNGNWSEGGKNLWANDNVSGTAFVKVTLAEALPAGTYTISAVVTSSDTDKTVCRIADGDGANTLALIRRSAGGARVSATFTIGSALSEISFYASETYYFSTGDTFSFTDIQIEAGSAATDYQPYAKTNVELTQELPQIESGTTAFTDGNEKVNFSKAFSTAPNVIAIPKYTTVTTGETPLLLKVYDVTTTYFRVRAIDNTGANVSSFTNATSFMWQAMS